MGIHRHFERVIWLAPGKFSGIATLGSDLSFTSSRMDFFTLGNEVESYARYHHNQLAVGYERSDDPRCGAEVVGMVKWVAYKFNATLLSPGSPAQGVPEGVREDLQFLRWYRLGNNEANKAAAHLLTWLRREGTASLTLVAELFPT